ncbi:hypothetical protein AD998_16320 [bacterium 336/3]|nr:hypothetical protein AD998_16320 [bacterium 336/3]
MLYPHFARKIIQMQKKDLALRDKLLKEGVLSESYHVEMEALHKQNAEKLEKIIDQIGYPTASKVGEKASYATWLVIQHAISIPAFMKNCAELLDLEVKSGNAYKKDWAYLTDRIAVLSNKKQLYGTQFDWDENAELSPNPIKYIKSINKRRIALGLNTLEEQIILIREFVQKEGQTPPQNYQVKKKEFVKWQKKVGWI